MAGHLNNPYQTRHNASVKTPFGLSTELPLQMFFDNILPPLRDDVKSSSVLEALRDDHLITEHHRWRGFAKDPKDSLHPVYFTFKHLEAVVRSIVKTVEATYPGAGHALRFESNSTSVARYPNNSDETFPDASFLDGSELRWENIAVCGEYEKDEVPDYAQDVSFDILYSAP